MNYVIRHLPTLRKLLWSDAFLGGITALAGLILSSRLIGFLGFTEQFILVVSAITLCYAIVAFYLATQKIISISLLRLLVMANWLWTLISILLLLMHFEWATTFGKIFLALQIIVVGGLAYLEGKQLIAQKNNMP